MPLVERERFDLIRSALAWRSLDLDGGREDGPSTR